MNEALDTFGYCQRPVFVTCIPTCIQNKPVEMLAKLKRSSRLQEDTERKNKPVTQLSVLLLDA